MSYTVFALLNNSGFVIICIETSRSVAQKKNLFFKRMKTFMES